MEKPASASVNKVKVTNLQKRVNRIQARLSQNDKKREQLEERLSVFKNKLENVESGTNGPQVNIQQRINRIQAKLNGKNISDEQRQKLKERLGLFETKLENKNKKTNNRAVLQQRLKRQENLLQKIDLNPVRRQEVERRVAGIRAKLQNQERKQAVGAREMNKKRLMSLEQRARENGNEAMLGRIALQQVYVGHYPTHDDNGQELKYIPVFFDELKQKAAMRQQAIERARTEPGVDWIASDQYERLPEFWSFDDEVAMFGNKKGKWKNPYKVVPLEEPEIVVCGKAPDVSAGDMETDWVDVADHSAGVI